MQAEHALLMLADWPVGAARAAVTGLPQRAMVVIRDTGPDGDRYYAVDAGSVQLVLEGTDTDLPLSIALGLSNFPHSRTVELGDPDVEPTPGDVVLRGREVLGVVRGTGSDRSAEAAPEMTFAKPPQPEEVVAVGAEPVETQAPTARFRAFPALDSPDEVREGDRFTLVARFTAHAPSTDPAEQPVIVANAPPQLTFVVQVGGFGFSFPDGIRRELTVDRDSPDGPVAEFTVEAGDVNVRATRTLEVSFEYEGELCGLAWRDVQVVATQETQPAPSQPSASGGTGVTLNVDTGAPSLTVAIRSEPGSAELEWLFHPRENIARPSQRVTTMLEAPSAEAFAVQLMAQLPAAKDAVSLPLTVRGLGKLVNRVIPDDFWAMVEATWRATPNGQLPSLLLTTSEPFVPWELAWVDDEVVDPTLLPAGVTEGPLGSLWRVGRWVPPVRRRRGPDRPAVPPAARVDADALAVVIGDYGSDTKIRNLPYAVEEGRAIAMAYAGLPLTVSEGDVDRLMNGALERDGAAYSPTVVHFASHGQVSTAQQQYTGILLSGGRRLDLLTVEGSLLGESSAPFVFLNACQVGTASTVLSTYGGLAGAFLSNGCRGFLAPLWNVDDEVAKSIALGFYQRTLGEGLPVGEAVRQIRAGFGRGEAGTATPLAYVFYGHPDLQLNRQPEGGS